MRTSGFYDDGGCVDKWHRESAEPPKPAEGAKCPTCGSDDKTIHRAYQCGHSDCPCTGYRWHECEDLWHKVEGAQESMNAREFHAKWFRSKGRILTEYPPSKIEIEFAEAYASQENAALREQIEGLRAALRNVLTEAVILSENYLEVFNNQPDTVTIQGWDKARWRRALAAKKQAEAALATQLPTEKG